MACANRHLKDKAMDNIDHALGRPYDPMDAGNYRNRFAICDPSRIAEFRASPYWDEGHTVGDMTLFHVTEKGRGALAKHLKAIGDPHRLYSVHFDLPGHETWPVLVVAKSRSAARYSHYLDVSDAFTDLTFKDFCKHTTARLARCTARKTRHV